MLHAKRPLINKFMSVPHMSQVTVDSNNEYTRQELRIKILITTLYYRYKLQEQTERIKYL